MPSISLTPPRGTRDFYPEALRRRKRLFDVFREVSRRFGFEEVDAPVLEHAELYLRKAGEEISEQLYRFELHGRDLALRPEFTPSLARMVMARRGELRFPLRWFSIPQCWRYERMMRGRRREHYQWNMDIWGEADVSAEAELAAAVFCAVDELGLAEGDLLLRVNHRALLEESLRERFLQKRPEAFAPLCVLIDKLDKIGAEAVVQGLADAAGEVRMDAGAARELVERLQAPAAQGLDRAEAFALPNSPALLELRRFFDLLDAYGMADRVRFDASLVRGLAYYTGIVFEAIPAQGGLRAVCGGGRYDRLLETLGGKALPAVGFGFGDAVISELLEERGRLPDAPRELDAVVYPMSEAERPAAVHLATALRARGESAVLVLGETRARRVFSAADRDGAARVYIIGGDELARGVVKVRELASGEEHEEPLPS